MLPGTPLPSGGGSLGCYLTMRHAAMVYHMSSGVPTSSGGQSPILWCYQWCYVHQCSPNLSRRDGLKKRVVGTGLATCSGDSAALGVVFWRFNIAPPCSTRSWDSNQMFECLQFMVIHSRGFLKSGYPQFSSSYLFGIFRCKTIHLWGYPHFCLGRSKMPGPLRALRAPRRSTDVSVGDRLSPGAVLHPC